MPFQSVGRAPRYSRLALGILLAGVAATLGCGGSDEPADAPGAAGPAVTVLAQGGPLHGSNGIMFGPDGNLYIASVVSSQILAIDPESGETVGSWGPAEGVIGPDDLAFGPDGSLYWTDIAGGEVGKRAPDGTTSIVGAPGPGANPITFSDDGRLFVSQCFLGTHLFEIDPDGVAEPRLINDELGPGCGLNGMDWGPDDKLYGPRWFNGEVARVDVDSGAAEIVATDFGIPAAVKFDSQGRLHVLDTQRGEVVRIDVASGDREVVGRPGVGLDNLALDGDDRIFVSSFMDGSIVEVTGPETNRVVLPSTVNSPGGVAYTAAGRLFLADGGALRELDPSTGASVHTVAAMVTDVGQVTSVHPHGDYLVLSGANLGGSTMVTVWDPDADAVVARVEGFEEAVDALAYGGDLIVTEYGTGSVLRFHPDSPDDRAAIASGLAEPAGLALHGGDLYVTDRSGAVLQVLDDGETVEPARTVASGLAGPEGIAADDDGVLYVVEVEAGRVTRIDPRSGAAMPVVDGLALSGPEPRALGPATSVGELAGIAVGDAALFVSAYRDNRVYRIER
jgi:sugar lactone lactonase YvrE